MPAMRLFKRSEWEARLARVHCEPLQGKTKLNTAEWWKAPWGFVFTVPVDQNDMINQIDLSAVIADVVADAPPGYSFEDH
jgi:hypothetical protein